MKKLLLLFIFCLHLKAQSIDSAVDIAFLKTTSLWMLNVFLVDVDTPDAVPIQFTDDFDYSQCRENNYDNPEGLEECELREYPPYLGVWQLERRNLNFSFENMETGERISLYRCVEACAYSLSPDGRWLLLDDYRLLDLSLFEETEAIYISHGYSHSQTRFWLDAHHLLYWQGEYERYFVYDTEAGLNYRFEDVLDRETLSINTEGVEGFAVLPDIDMPDESIVPIEIQQHSSIWALRPDSSGVVYGSSDYEVPEPQFCYNCAVAFWDIENESSEILFGLEASGNNHYSWPWQLLSLQWSFDGSQFIAGFNQIDVFDDPNYYWLYDMETGELRQVFAGDWAVQWLR